MNATPTKPRAGQQYQDANGVVYTVDSNRNQLVQVVWRNQARRIWQQTVVAVEESKFLNTFERVN